MSYGTDLPETASEEEVLKVGPEPVNVMLLVQGSLL